MVRWMRFAALAALVLAVVCGGQARAQGTPKTAAQLATEFNTNLPSGNPSVLTAASLRATLNDMVASWQANPRRNAQTGTTYTVALADFGQLVTFSNANPVAVTLPQATGSFAAFNFFVKNVGVGTATITPAGGSTINGAATLDITTNIAFQIVSDGVNYQVIGPIGAGAGSGTVNAGTTGQMAYYASNGTAVSGLSTTIDVKEYGAVCNGAADDTTAIQNAINAVPTGGTLLFTKSICKISSKLTVSTPGITLLCGGANPAVAGTMSIGQGNGTALAINANNVNVLGCIIDRSGTPQVNDHGIVVGDDSNATATDAICTNGSATVTSAGNHFSAAVAGMRIKLPSCAAAGATLFASILTASAGSITVTPSPANTPGAGVAALYGNVYTETVLRDVQVTNHAIGVWWKDAAQQHADHLLTNSNTGIQVENQLAPDYGDSFISNSTILSNDSTNGIGLEHLSSGGLKISNTKFLFGKYNIDINWSLGGSAGTVITGSYLESSNTAALHIVTPQPLQRLTFTGNQVAGSIIGDNTSASTLTDLMISGNAIGGVITVGKVNGGNISGNIINNASAGTCVTLQGNASNIRVLNNFYNCATRVTDSGTADVIVLPVVDGGTGTTTFTNHGVLLGQGATAIGTTGVGATGTVLRGQTGADPIFGAVNLTTDVTGVLPPANGGAAVSCAGVTVNATGACPTPSIAARFGGFDVWQRLVNAATTIAQNASVTAYANDGWYLITNANQAATITQATGIATGSQFAAKIQRNNGQTGTGVIRYAAPLFLDEIAMLRGYNVALSFTILEGANQSFSHTVTYTVYCGTGAAAKRGASAYTGETTPISSTVTTTTSAARVTATSAAVIPANCTQMEIQFNITPSGTAGADDSFTVDDLDIEPVASSTTTAPPFPHWPPNEQLNRARAVFRLIGGGTASARTYVGLAESTSVMSTGGPLSPPMKSTPNPSFAGTAANIACNDLSVAAAFQGTFGSNFSSPYAYGIQLNCANTLTQARAGFIAFTTAAEALFLSSEL